MKMLNMKTFITLLLSAAVFAGCNFSKGAKKDFSTGLSFNYNGFAVQDVLLVDSANNKMSDNKVPLNTQIAVVAVGINNYALKDGKAYPGMMLQVTDKNGMSVLNAADLFADDQGHPPAAASELRGNITVAQPMKSGETYHVKVHIWDKVKADNVVNAEVDVVVK
jgi:predicted small secreted protein